MALGSNLGDRESHLASALRHLERADGVVVLRRSRWIETRPVGGPPGQGDYLNGAALLETRLSPEELLEVLMGIEAKLGRERGEANGPRTLDLDLLLHGEERRDVPRLILPHPRMLERAFVLEPLAEIAPEWVVTPDGRTVAECWKELAERPPLVECADPAAAREWAREQRAAGRTIGFVPTMGALHEGHFNLVRRARAECDVVCVSIFVNPLQFDQKDDLAAYPRDFAGDAAQLASIGCSMAFTGTLEQFFPEIPAGGELPPERWIAPGPGALGLEGAFRSGHFEGVATIVDRLFEIVAPDRAYFGRKDFQQTLVVADLARRRGGISVVVCPTTREAGGLAMSSRNRRLDAELREQALAIPRALAAARAAWVAGERGAATLQGTMGEELAGAGLEVEYAEVRDPEAWSASAPTGDLTRAVALIAARAGAVRLIDNHDLSEPFPWLDPQAPEPASPEPSTSESSSPAPASGSPRGA